MVINMIDNKKNYAVDLGTDKDICSDLVNLLSKIAKKYNWTLLGWTYPKRYFRFGYADDSCDAGEGFYYWTADFMTDQKYEMVTIEKATILLSKIDKTLEEKVYLDTTLCKVGSISTQIGCRRIVNTDLSMLELLMKTNDIPKITVYTAQSDYISVSYLGLCKLNKIIKKKGS